MMPEAFTQKWQEYEEDGKKEQLFILQAARRNNVNVISSSPLMQGALIQVPLPSNILQCSSLGAKHLQFIRSIPADSLLSKFGQDEIIYITVSRL